MSDPEARDARPAEWWSVGINAATLLILVLTLAAAGVAAFQAYRQVEVTQIALSDARAIATQQAADTAAALALARQSADASKLMAEVMASTERPRIMLSNFRWREVSELKPGPPLNVGRIAFRIANVGSAVGRLREIGMHCYIAAAIPTSTDQIPDDMVMFADNAVGANAVSENDELGFDDCSVPMPDAAGIAELAALKTMVVVVTRLRYEGLRNELCTANYIVGTRTLTGLFRNIRQVPYQETCEVSVAP